MNAPPVKIGVYFLVYPAACQIATVGFAKKAQASSAIFSYGKAGFCLSRSRRMLYNGASF
jgi:hypothetical protein